MPSQTNIVSWSDFLSKDMNSSQSITLEFISHSEEVFSKLTCTNNELQNLCASIKSRLENGEKLTLAHEINQETYPLLPDLVRYIDDNFPGIEALKLIIQESDAHLEDIEKAQSFFMSAVTTCLARELPFQAPIQEPWANWAGKTTFVRKPVEPSEVRAERVALAKRPGNPEHEPQELEKMLHYLGGVERFFGDEVGHILGSEFGARLEAGSLELSASEREAIEESDPRSARRYAPSLKAHQKISGTQQQSADETSRVLIHLSAPQESTESLLKSLLSFATKAIAQPELLLSGCTNEEQITRIKQACAEQHIPFHLCAAETKVLETGRRYDFQINLCSHKTGALDSSFGLWDSEGLKETRNKSLSDWSAELPWHEIQPWTFQEPAPSDFILTSQGIAIERKAPSAADLWILDLPDTNLWIAGFDPIPIERLANDATQSQKDWLTKLIDERNPYARPEGVQTYGDVALGEVSNPIGIPALIKEKNRRLIVLGLASTTLQNHGATLLIDGQIVGAVQEERFRRRKQLGWHPPGKPYDTVVSNPRIPLERSWPMRSIECVLEMGGISIEDVDCIAYNGIPQQYLHTYDLYDPSRPPHTIADGRNMFVPHHLTHAASAYRVSGLKESVIFTVDGRGERETAAFFEVSDGRIHRLFDILCNKDSLIGGVYEFFTTILGFGHHGAGSTMGLACMGPPSFDVSNFLHANNRNSYEIHDHGIEEAWGHLSRAWGDPMTKDHIALASSVQFALEKTVLNLIADGLGPRRKPNLCMAGGVALNCRMNQVVRQYFDTPQIFVQPAAHDSGTSLGAALEAHFEITGEAQPTTMEHALLGPSYSNEKIAKTLKSFGLAVDQRADIATEVGDLVADGKIVCWFQDGLEFGPRALGARSILSDPRYQETKDRMNTMKGRQWWRPLGPSILAGHEADWFEQPMHSPFMLFTLPVREDKKEKIPAVLHLDGTSRPQSVSQSTHPRYHRAINQFYQNTGVPMVVNTSFNTAFEPIVNTPEDAISTFLQLGADFLAIGDFLVRQP